MKNVAETLENKATSLYEKLASSRQAATAIMGIIGRIVWDCANRNIPVEGVVMGEVTESCGDFRFKVSFSRLNMSPTLIWRPAGDLLGYVAGKSASLARAIERNAGLVDGLGRLAEAMDRFAVAHGSKFEDLEIKKAFVSREDVYVISTGVKANKWGL